MLGWQNKNHEMHRRELTEQDLNRMQIPARYWKVSFGEISSEGNPSAQEVVKQYISNLDDMVSRGVGLLLWSDNGIGKTSIAVVIAKEMCRREKSVLFCEAADLKRAVFEKHMFDEDQSFWDRACSVDVLILDDLGKGVQDSVGAGARLIDEMIRHRNARKLITFITTNMAPSADQLGKELKKSTMEVLKECVIPVHVEGKNRRDEIKEEISKILTGNGNGNA